jgi:hypothetical protein
MPSRIARALLKAAKAVAKLLGSPLNKLLAASPLALV